MKQKPIIPITKRDFQAIEEMIGINQNKYCPYCNELLEKYRIKNSKEIIYLCYYCDTVWEKEIIDENHFKLVKSERLFII